ncbi:hypothetical protein SBADM41S_03094 [Streptomyces badius]
MVDTAAQAATAGAFARPAPGDEPWHGPEKPSATRVPDPEASSWEYELIFLKIRR